MISEKSLAPNSKSSTTICAGSSVTQICGLFGYTKQAYYKEVKRSHNEVMARAIVLKEVEHIRQKIPGVGVVKLHYMLQQTMEVHHIKMGRDKHYDLFGFYGLLIRRKRRRKPITTDSDHRFYKYPNLIGGLQISSPNQVWVSDITYLRVNE